MLISPCTVKVQLIRPDLPELVFTREEKRFIGDDAVLYDMNRWINSKAEALLKKINPKDLIHVAKEYGTDNIEYICWRMPSGNVWTMRYLVVPDPDVQSVDIGV